MARIHSTAMVDPSAQCRGRRRDRTVFDRRRQRGHRRGHGDRAACGHRRTHDPRPAQSRLPVRLDRRNRAGPQVRRRADHDDHRRRQRVPRVRDRACRHRAGSRRHDDRQRQPVPRLYARGARLRGRQPDHVLQQRADRGPCAHRRLGGAGRVCRRAPVLPRRCARDARRVRGRAAGRAAVRDRAGLSGQAARHQQRGPAPARLFRRRLLQIRRAYKTLYRENLALEEARAQIEAAAAGVPALAPLAQFLAVPGRGIVR